MRAVTAAKRVELPNGPSPVIKKAKLKLLDGTNPRSFDGAYLEHFGVADRPVGTAQQAALAGQQYGT